MAAALPSCGGTPAVAPEPEPLVTPPVLERGELRKLRRLQQDVFGTGRAAGVGLEGAADFLKSADAPMPQASAGSTEPQAEAIAEAKAKAAAAAARAATVKEELIDDFMARIDRAAKVKARQAQLSGGPSPATSAESSADEDLTGEGLGSHGGPLPTNEGTWTCSACGLIFESRQQCVLHMRAVHVRPDPVAEVVYKPAPAELQAEAKAKVVFKPPPAELADPEPPKSAAPVQLPSAGDLRRDRAAARSTSTRQTGRGGCRSLFSRKSTSK